MSEVMTETNPERLARLLKVILPHQAEQIETGEWGPNGAPYKFITNRPDGQRKLVIENHDTGDVIGVVGSTQSELLDKLEARLTGGQ